MTNAITTAINNDAAATIELNRVCARGSRAAMNTLGRQIAIRAVRLAANRKPTFEEIEMGIRAAEKVCYL